MIPFNINFLHLFLNVTNNVKPNKLINSEKEKNEKNNKRTSAKSKSGKNLKKRISKTN